MTVHCKSVISWPKLLEKNHVIKFYQASQVGNKVWTILIVSICMSIHTAVNKFLKSCPKIDCNQNMVSSLVCWNHFFAFASFKIQVWNLAETFFGRPLLVMLPWMTSGMKQLRFDYPIAYYSQKCEGIVYTLGHDRNPSHSWISSINTKLCRIN